MSVHYKFKTSLEYDTLTFDGLHISVADLKAAIFQQKRIGKTSDFDLQITNAQTKEVYSDNNTLVPKNTSLLVARVPLAQKPKKTWDGSNSTAPLLSGTRLADGVSAVKGSADLSRMEGSEEDKIMEMMSQSTQEYDPSNYQNFRGSNQRGELPPNYRCYKCHETGHWIKDCPLGNNAETIDLKRSTGIPRSFMVPVEGPSAPGAMITPTGAYAVPAVDHEAYKASDSGVDQPSIPSEPARKDIPEDLLCSLCKDLLTDAVMIPCCGNSFCDECIRGALLESEDHECPDCRDKEISPSTLIPNRFLRSSVATFRNQTGYIPKPRPPPVPKSLPTAESVESVQHPESSTVPQTDDEEPKAEMPARRKSKDEIDEDSDGSYEDNITVTVPPMQTPSLRHTQQFNTNGSKPSSVHQFPQQPSHPKLQQADDYGRPLSQNVPYGTNLKSVLPKPPGLDSTPSSQMSPSMHDNRSSTATPIVDERKMHLQSVRGAVPVQVVPILRPKYLPPNTRYPPPGVPVQQYNPYGPVGPINVPPQYGAPIRPYQPPYQNAHPGIGPSGITPHKPAPGIIEDPLEAFERMIKQKEELARMREKRSRSRSRSRSRPRSITRSRSRFTRSRSRSRLRSRSFSRSRSRPTSIRSPMRRAVEKYRRASFSRSPLPRRPIRSPIRRSRERSKSFSGSRSRSPLPAIRDGPPRRRTPPRFRSPLRGPRDSPRIRFNNVPPHKRDIGESRSLRSPPQTHSQGLPLMEPHHRFGHPPSNVPINSLVPVVANDGPALRYGSPLEDAPPGTQPPPPGEQSPVVRRDDIAPPGIMDRNKDRPASPFRDHANFRDHRPITREMRDGAPGFSRDAPPGVRAEYRDVPPGIRDGPPGIRDGPPGIRDGAPSGVRDRPQTFRDGPPGFRETHPHDFRENHSSFRDGPPGIFRDPIHTSFRDVPPATGFRDNIPQGPYRDRLPVPGYRDGPPPAGFRDGPPPASFRDGPPPAGFRDGPPPAGFRDGPPPAGFRDGPPPGGYRDGAPPFRDGPPSFRDGTERFRDGAPPYRDNNFRDPSHRDRQVHNREGFSHNRENHPHNNRDVPHGRDNLHSRDSRSHHDRASRDHHRHEYNKGDRHRDKEIRDFRETDKRERDHDRVRNDKSRDYDKNRNNFEKDIEHGNYSPERKRRSTSLKRELRDERSRHRKGDSHGKSKDSVENKREYKNHEKTKNEDDKIKDKDRKLRDKKKKKKEKDVEKKKRKEKKEKKDKQEASKEGDEQSQNNDEKQNLVPENNDLETEMQLNNEPENNTYNDMEGDNDNDKSTFDEDKTEDKINNDEDEKDISFDGIELQASDLDLKLELFETSRDKTKNEMLAPVPELSKWEIDDDQTSGNERKEPGEIDSPDKLGKVTSEVLKRAENAIFAKAINAIRPIEIKRISSDRVKLYSGETEDIEFIEQKDEILSKKTTDTSIQITIPTDTDQRSVEINEVRKVEDRTPPKLSVKDRLGSKIEEPPRRPRELHSTVERIRSRSRSPQGKRAEKDSQRRVMIDSSRDRSRRFVTKVSGLESRNTNEYRTPGRHDRHFEEYSHHRNRDVQKVFSPPKDERKRERNASIGSSPDRKMRRKDKKHRKEREEKHEKKYESDNTKSNDMEVTEKNKPKDGEKKKSTLDESNFEPDYEETVAESDNEGKEKEVKLDVKQKALEEENQTIKLDLSNVRMKTKSESSSSSEDSTSSSSTSSDSKKRKRKKRKNKKKKKKHYSDSGSDSGSSSDEPKKKKKKHKHKKKSSKKKKKLKSKNR